jgi:hypothetical protein
MPLQINRKHKGATGFSFVRILAPRHGLPEARVLFLGPPRCSRDRRRAVVGASRALRKGVDVNGWAPGR